jgi:hypothetical protein
MESEILHVTLICWGENYVKLYIAKNTIVVMMAEVLLGLSIYR